MTEEERAVSKERRREYMAAYMREYRKVNPERVQQHHKKYYEGNKAKIMAARKARCLRQLAEAQQQ